MKKLPNTKKLKRRSFTCTDRDYKLLERMAAENDCSVSKLVWKLVSSSPDFVIETLRDKESSPASSGRRRRETT